MYVPPFKLLMKCASIDEANGTISLPLPVFRLFLDAAMGADSFDQDWYVSVYQDVADAVAQGRLSSGRQHFVDAGYFESRHPCIPFVDEEWYMDQYEDIKEAVHEGALATASMHFLQAGRDEGRTPNRDVADTVSKWKNAIEGAARTRDAVTRDAVE